MFNVGGGELVVIALVALIVLGPERLPGAARQVGKMMTELRSMSQGFTDELRSAAEDTREAAAFERGQEHVAQRPAAGRELGAATPDGAADPAPASATEAPAEVPGASGTAPGATADDPTPSTEAAPVAEAAPRGPDAEA